MDTIVDIFLPSKGVIPHIPAIVYHILSNTYITNSIKPVNTFEHQNLDSIQQFHFLSPPLKQRCCRQDVNSSTKKKINRQKQEGNQYRKPKCFINRFEEKDNKVEIVWNIFLSSTILVCCFIDFVEQRQMTKAMMLELIKTWVMLENSIKQNDPIFNFVPLIQKLLTVTEYDFYSM